MGASRKGSPGCRRPVSSGLCSPGDFQSAEVPRQAASAGFSKHNPGGAASGAFRKNHRETGTGHRASAHSRAFECQHPEPAWLAGAILLLALVFLLCGCTAGQGALGLRAADTAAHIAGVEDRLPGAHEALHEEIDRLDAQDPEAPIGWAEWLAIAVAIVGGGFGVQGWRRSGPTKSPPSPT